MHGRWLEAPVETFGGLCDAVEPNDLPPWMAREALNCAWKPGSVAKRAGFTKWFSALGSVRGLFSWPTRVLAGNASGRQLVIVTGNGDLESRGADGSYLWGVPDRRAGVPVTPTFAKLYDRIILGTSDGKRAALPVEILRYADAGTIRESQLYMEPPPLALNLTVLVGGGTMTAGQHTLWATFEFDDGSMSPPTPPASVTVAANDRISATFADTGAAVPVLIGARAIWVWCSPAGDTQNGYFVGRVHWTGLPVVVTDADGVLTTQERLDLLPLQRTAAPLLASAVAGPYKGRVLFIGAPHRYTTIPRTAANTWNNSFVYNGASSRPGWGVPAAGGAHSPGQYVITFDGVSASRGALSSAGTVVGDLGTRCEKGSTTFTAASWGVRVVAKRTAAMGNGGLKVGGTGASGSWSQTFTTAEIGEGWTVLEARAVGTTWANNMVPYVEGVGPGVLGETISVRLVEIFDPGSRVEAESVYWSRIAAPREVDLTLGPVTIATASGQAVKTGFELGSRYFYVLTGSLWATEDNGGEPVQWPVELVANGIGTPSHNGAAVGRDWAVIVGPSGCWLFTGGGVSEEANLAKELQGKSGTKGTWDRIPWDTYGHKVWVRVLEDLRQVWVGVPLDDATEVSHVLVMDYNEGLHSAVASGGVGRRWSLWTVGSTAPAVEFKNAADSEKTILCSGADVLFLDETSHNDNGAGFSWAWEGGPTGMPGGGLGLFRRLLISAEGNGGLGMALRTANGGLKTLISPTLYSPRRGDQVGLCSLTDERVGVRFWQGATAGTWARINRATLAWMRRPFASVRPQNP